MGAAVLGRYDNPSELGTRSLSHMEAMSWSCYNACKDMEGPCLIPGIQPGAWGSSTKLFYLGRITGGRILPTPNLLEDELTSFLVADPSD